MRKSKEYVLKLHTVPDYGLTWIYKCIDFGFAIAAKEGVEIENFSMQIIAHGPKKIITPNLILAKIANKIACKYLKKIDDDYDLDATELMVSKGEYHNKIILSSRSNGVMVEKKEYALKLIDKINLYINAVIYYFKYLIGKDKFQKNILDLNYKSVVIGDIIAAETLRHYQSFGGALRGSNALFHNLYNAMYLVNYYSSINIGEDYVLTPDLTYFPELLSRVALLKGSSVGRAAIDFGDYSINNASDIKIISYNIKSNFDNEKINS